MNESSSVQMSAGLTADEQGRVRKPVGVVDLLHWAFQRECAQVEFPDDQRGSVSLTYATMSAYRLGTRVDGGGWSPNHPDADLVAAAVACLPEGCGGRNMAVTIAELARAGVAPDWMPDAQPACLPVEWRNSKHGRQAKTVSVGTQRMVYRGKVAHLDVRVCPVVHLNTASEIARRRRFYLLWWSALLELRETFRAHNNLSAYAVTDAMPPMRPWEKRELTRKSKC